MTITRELMAKVINRTRWSTVRPKTGCEQGIYHVRQYFIHSFRQIIHSSTAPRSKLAASTGFRGREFSQIRPRQAGQAPRNTRQSGNQVTDRSPFTCALPRRIGWGPRFLNRESQLCNPRTTQTRTAKGLSGSRRRGFGGHPGELDRRA
jgi:hypothetical protein